MIRSPGGGKEKKNLSDLGLVLQESCDLSYLLFTIISWGNDKFKLGPVIFVKCKSRSCVLNFELFGKDGISEL